MTVMHLPIEYGYDFHCAKQLFTKPVCSNTLNQLGCYGVGIIDETVQQLHGQYFKQSFGPWLKHMITVPAGEASKSRAMKAEIERQLFSAAHKRNICIVALGGGMVLDLAGFVAATYLRGVPVVYCPTTLLAMVDACIGGKVAINTPFGKNTLGVVRQPHLILADLHTLTTLPRAIWFDGMAEVIKHAVIADGNFFQWLQQNVQLLQQRDPDTVHKMLTRSCRIKCQFVQADPQDKQRRQCLNFGHTFGHVLEMSSDFQLSHGRAVAHGMVVANYLAQQQQLLTPKAALQIEQLLQAFELLTPVPQAWVQSEASLWQQLGHDKKNTHNTPHCLLLQQIGQLASTHEGWLHPMVRQDWVQGLAQWSQKYMIHSSSDANTMVTNHESC